MQKSTNTLVIAAVAILAIGLCLAPNSSIIYQTAKAQLRSDRVVQGASLTGTVTCPSGTQFSNGLMFFQTTKSRGGQFGGGFGIYDSNINQFEAAKSGDITGGHFGGKTFVLTGIERQDFMCNPSTPFISTTFTLSGQCGPSSTVTLKTANGETGTFTGSVACA